MLKTGSVPTHLPHLPPLLRMTRGPPGSDSRPPKPTHDVLRAMIKMHAVLRQGKRRIKAAYKKMMEDNLSWLEFMQPHHSRGHLRCGRRSRVL